MTIRELTPEDTKAYWDLRLEALQTEPLAFGRAVEEHLTLSLKTTAERLRSIPDAKFNLGAFAGGTLVGTATFVREGGVKDRHKGRIYGVYVTASHRGQGAGRRLIAELIHKTRGFAGLEQILLSVAAHQTAAVRLYEGAGFRRYGLEPRALKVGGRYVDESHMILML